MYIGQSPQGDEKILYPELFLPSGVPSSLWVAPPPESVPAVSILGHSTGYLSGGKGGRQIKGCSPRVITGGGPLLLNPPSDSKWPPLPVQSLNVAE